MTVCCVRDGKSSPMPQKFQSDVLPHCELRRPMRQPEMNDDTRFAHDPVWRCRDTGKIWQEECASARPGVTMPLHTAPLAVRSV